MMGAPGGPCGSLGVPQETLGVLCPDRGRKLDTLGTICGSLPDGALRTLRLLTDIIYDQAYLSIGGQMSIVLHCVNC
ncbi:hypothetical protein NDU88_005055 [Pleurodeles waltl]|uniref:Uncharacterized protein n=1 Tax=Pleurodeles waltl TaxID=8319 RepID=A0AAV7V374_PLEWA|nr:hypothetical protein NDU88_005055 [Pleurodeles waltl]